MLEVACPAEFGRRRELDSRSGRREDGALSSGSCSFNLDSLRQVRQSQGLKSGQASFLRAANAVLGDKLERAFTAEGPWDFLASEGTGQDSSSLDSTRLGSVVEDGRSRCSEDSSCASAAPGRRSTSYDGGFRSAALQIPGAQRERNARVSMDLCRGASLEISVPFQRLPKESRSKRSLADSGAGDTAMDEGADTCGPMSHEMFLTKPFATRRCFSMSEAQINAHVQEMSEDEDVFHVDEVARMSRGSGEVPFSSGPFYLSEDRAAAELFLRLNHARQSIAFVKRQVSLFSRLDRMSLGVWEALELLDGMREYETALLGDEGTDPGMSLLEHAFQTAEACRLAHPEHDWLHLVGLIHGLGKLLANPRCGYLFSPYTKAKLLNQARMGSEPQWAVCGEGFPVGCSFRGVSYPQFFSVNPDRRRRVYNTPTGIYREGCGLASVYMSWSACEYLYMMLLLNRTLLPPEALFIIRNQKFYALDSYASLLSPADREMVPWLPHFQELAKYRRCLQPQALVGAERRTYYDRLIQKYIPHRKLRW